MFSKSALALSALLLLAASAQAQEALQIQPTHGKHPLQVQITGPSYLVDAINKCVTSHEWQGKGGNGVTVNWGDGTDDLENVPLNTPCADMQGAHAFPRPDIYHVVVTLWHPGATDAPITDWTGLATITVTQ
ncbi:MAG: hypothetical protein P4M15_10980 [Alphaproteobacteria bacterium]|nr:hypothetical protein [Alphaproteobacteria bacterium]